MRNRDLTWPPALNDSGDSQVVDSESGRIVSLEAAVLARGGDALPPIDRAAASIPAGPAAAPLRLPRGWRRGAQRRRALRRRLNTPAAAVVFMALAVLACAEAAVIALQMYQSTSQSTMVSQMLNQANGIARSSMAAADAALRAATSISLSPPAGGAGAAQPAVVSPPATPRPAAPRRTVAAAPRPTSARSATGADQGRPATTAAAAVAADAFTAAPLGSVRLSIGDREVAALREAVNQARSAVVPSAAVPSAAAAPAPAAAAPATSPAPTAAVPVAATTAAAPPPPAPPAARAAAVTAPVALQQNMPAIPLDIRRALPRDRSGVIEVLIGTDGRVQRATLVQPLHPAFDSRLLTAARTWRYEPARQNGVPVDYVKSIRIDVED